MSPQATGAADGTWLSRTRRSRFRVLSGASWRRSAHHPHLGLSAKLTHIRWKPVGRDGFYIHGRGPHGSDGCIVPVNSVDFNNLMSALIQSNGGLLFVQETLDGARFA